MICLKCGKEVDVELESGLCFECQDRDSLDIELPELKKEDEVQEESFDAIKYVGDDLEDTKEFFINREIDLEKTRAISVMSDTKEYDLFTLEDEINRQIESNNVLEDDTVKVFADGGFDPDDDLSRTTIMRNFSNVSNLETIMGKDKITKEEEYRDGVKISQEITFDKEDEEAVVSEDVTLPKTNTRSLMEDDLSTKESVKSRKNNLIIAFVCTFIAILVILFGISYFLDGGNNNVLKNNNTVNLDNFDSVLDSYYTSYDVNEITSILEDVKSDSKKVETIQEKVSSRVSLWVSEFKTNDLNSKDNFEKVYDSNKILINNLYNVSTKYDDTEIKLITLGEYKEYMDTLENIYDDGLPYYTALDSYKSKAYDESYQLFDYVDSDNMYYEKAVLCKEDIVLEVINLLKNDIAKLEDGIDSLSDDKKMDRYISIQDIIIVYNDIYDKVNLSDNEEYQALLQKYNQIVSGE